MNEFSNSDYLVDKTTHSDFNTYQNSGYIVNDSSFLFAISRNDQIDVIKGKVNRSTETLFSLLKDNYEREKYYITAIKNLLKQKNYINLIYELTNNLINEEEFNFELSENESKYLIKANEQLDSLHKIKTLINVLNNIDENLHEEDLIEIFSISDSFIFKNIALFSKSKQIHNEASSQ
ncbi:hypothetical protein [Peijinzhouia sedimentorum]